MLGSGCTLHLFVRTSSDFCVFWLPVELSQIKKPIKTLPNHKSASIGPSGHSSLRKPSWTTTLKSYSRAYVNVVSLTWPYKGLLLKVELVRNLVAHGDAREGKWRGNWRMEWVASALTPPPNVVYPALLKQMRTTRLPAVYWTDAPTDLNGLVRFGERRNLVSARVLSHSARAILCPFGWREFWLDRCLEFETIVGRSRRLKAFVTSGSVTSNPWLNGVGCWPCPVF